VAGELTVVYATVALRFAAISVDGVVEAVGGRKLEICGLSREGPETCSEEEKPRQKLTPVGRLSRKQARYSRCCSPLLVSTGTSLYVSPDSSKNRATLAGLGVGWK
jgi:hypothetical protein